MRNAELDCRLICRFISFGILAFARHANDRKTYFGTTANRTVRTNSQIHHQFFHINYKRRGTHVLRSARARAPVARRAHILDEMALAWSPKLEAMASSMRCDEEAYLDEAEPRPPFRRTLSWVVRRCRTCPYPSEQLARLG